MFGCAVSRRYIDVCYCDLFSVVYVYLYHLKFCVVCINGRRYVCCGECYVVSDEPTSCLVQPIGAHCCEVMYFGCFDFRGARLLGCEGDGHAGVGPGGGVVVVSAYMGGTRGSGIFASVCDVLGMIVVRGVVGVCDTLIGSGRGGRCSGWEVFGVSR